MKKRIAFTAVFLLVSFVLSVMFFMLPEKISREEYPYIGYSILDYSDLNPFIEMVLPPDKSINLLLKQNPIIVIGRFLNSTYDEKHTPPSEQHELLYEIIEVIGDELKLGEIITVVTEYNYYYTRSHKRVLPTVETGDIAVLFLRQKPKNYCMSVDGFFYIDEYDRVISGSKYPSLDQYTGMKLKTFMIILREKYEAAKSAQPTS